jgi:hypothetical protein
MNKVPFSDIIAIAPPPANMKQAWYDFKSNVLLADSPGTTDFRDTCRSFYAGAFVLAILLADAKDDDDTTMAEIAEEIGTFLYADDRTEP